MKQSCMLRKRGCFASLKSRSEKKRHSPIDRSRTSGCSILLNQPMNWVSQPARDPVGEQEIDVLLLEQAQDLGSERHGTVKSVR